MGARRWAAPLAVTLSGVVLAAATGCGSSGGGAGSPERAGSTSPAATTQTKQFTSVVYPYSVTLSDAWFETYGQTAWDGTSALSGSSPAFDYYRDGTNQVFVGAAALPAQERLERWRDTVVAAAPSSCTHAAAVEQSSLDGERALEWTETCNGGSEALIKLVALHHGHGYLLGLLSPASSKADADRQLFDSTRRSFRFTG